MNYVVNDLGKTVVAVGAPGSIERVKCERPGLISRLNSLYAQAYDCHGRAVDEAVEIIRQDGIVSPLETNSILMASDYGREPEGSVTSLVLKVGGKRE